MNAVDAARRALVRQWLEKAEEDFAAAQFLLSHGAPYPHVISFHAQQAAEKYLKALLSWQQIGVTAEVARRALEVAAEVRERIVTVLTPELKSNSPPG